MQLSEALEQVSKMYVNGAVEFFNAKMPNPWQDAHDKLEGSTLLYRESKDYFKIQDTACKEFVKEIRRLLDAYKMICPEQPTFPNAFDSFVIGDEEKIKILQCLAEYSCTLCGAKEQIRVTKHEKLGSSLFCTGCVP